VGEEAAEGSPPSVPSMSIMTDVQALLAMLFAAEAPAEVVMGMPMQKGSPENV
jgi:hypothetical protein